MGGGPGVSSGGRGHTVSCGGRGHAVSCGGRGQGILICANNISSHSKHIIVYILVKNSSCVFVFGTIGYLLN